MNRRKAALLMGIGGLAAGVTDGAINHRPERPGEDCVHCAVLKINEQRVGCVACGLRFDFKAKAGFSLSYEGHAPEIA